MAQGKSITRSEEHEAPSDIKFYDMYVQNDDTCSYMNYMLHMPLHFETMNHITFYLRVQDSLAVHVVRRWKP